MSDSPRWARPGPRACDAVTATQERAAAPLEDFRRLHPLTPVLRGWKVLAVVFALLLQNSVRSPGALDVLVFVGVGVPVALAYGWLSWRFTRFGVVDGDLTLETGVLFRRSRRVSLARLEAVDVVRPLVARALGLAELRLEVAGAGSTEAALAYLSEPHAHKLRSELLARAAGIDAKTPEAPERVLVRVPLSAVVLSSLLRGPVIAALGWLVIVVVSVVVSGTYAALGILVPVLLGTGGALVTYVTSNFDFTVAESPDGLRLRRGLLETRAQTVPPGRVQAVRLAQPLLWRRRGWVRVDVNIAGYGGGDGSGQSTTLLPVAPRSVALQVLGHVLPGVDIDAVPLSGVPRRARWRAPVQWRQLGVGADDQVLVARRGRLFRELMAVPHARTQSVRLTCGPWQRRLGLATVHIDTAPGPVRVDAAHFDAAQAREIAEAQIQRARRSRAIAVPHRWMTTPQSPPVLEQGQEQR